MDNRNFQLENQWSAIYYPEKPAGFGVMIFGDERHFVDEGTSFWMQNAGKRQIISKLQEEGYTVFTSNFHGRHWGSPQAVLLAARLYEHVMKKEILNNKIHIIAEGMGALAALRFSVEMGSRVRSIVLINPILSLKHHLDLEKNHVFFYKKVLEEISAAYGMEPGAAEAEIAAEKGPVLNPGLPIKIFYILSGGRAFNMARTFKHVILYHQENDKISESYMLPEKAGQLGREISKFMSRYEKVL